MALFWFVPLPPPLLLIVLHLLHQPCLLEAENLTVGSTLRPPHYITSPSGDFAFGFRALDSGPDSRFLLAVWFNNINDASDPTHEKVVVWYARDPDSGSAVMATAQSVFSVTLAGQLSVADTTGSNIWTNANPSQQYGSVLVLLDSGNLQFLTAGGSTVVWESFRNPTDTLLPGQSMDSGAALVSKLSDVDFSPGRFSLHVQTDGNVVLYLNLAVAAGNNVDPYNAYWATGTNQPGNTPNGNTTLFFSSPGHIYYQVKDGTVRDLTPAMSNSTAGYYQRATLDPDGIVRVYVWARSSSSAVEASNGNASWDVTGLFPAQGCGMATRALDGFCGPNSYCVMSSADGRLDCQCPSGYSFVDAQLRYRGCSPVFAPQSCDVRETNRSGEFEIAKLPNTTWTASAYKIYTNTGEEQCGDFCLSDCFCVAAQFDGTRCTKMALLTGAGRQERNVTATALIKIRTTSPPTSTPASWRRVQPLPYILLVGCTALASLLLIAVTSLLVHWRIRRNDTDHDMLRAFTRKELYRATDGFRDDRLLGQGGFGQVYHGVVNSLSPPDIAVKMLTVSNEYIEREFANEVQSIGQIHHRNLVRMVGYCKEREQRMLVFEFLPGGSLQSFLQTSRPPWSWRAEAALGIAKGIEYLHEGCRSPIIHCDIKPDNILLDDNNNPKITDFGIARLLGNEQVYMTVTSVMGTRGYIAPEWVGPEGRIDTKVDVYSFGVMLVEMICCNRDRPDDHRILTTVQLLRWLEGLVQGGRTDELVVEEENAPSVERYASVAIWCIQVDPSMRPTMREVVRMLEGTMDVAPLPALSGPPDFSTLLLDTGSGTHHDNTGLGLQNE